MFSPRAQALVPMVIETTNRGERSFDIYSLLLKERISDPAMLVDALRRLVDGETVVDPTIVSRLLARRREADPVDELSDREREVLALVAEGLSNGEIGRRLFITERTVEAHVKQIFLKLGIGQAPQTNRRVLAVLAFLRSSVDG